MPKLTKKQFEDVFREEVLPYVIKRYEQDGIPDKPARREAWNDTVDAYIRDRTLPEAAGNWGHPRWLETYRPRGGSSHATKAAPKSQRAMYDEASRKSAEVNETFLEMLPTLRRRDLEKLIEKRPALWGRFAGYLKSGHVFVDDSPTKTQHRATMSKSSKSPTYTVHGHFLRRDGRQEAFWTRTGLSKSAADKLAREQRAESGGVAKVVVESDSAGSAMSSHHHATTKQSKQPKSAAQLDREIVEVVGPSAGTWKKSDRPINSEHLDIGHAGARVQPLYYGGADYYEWSIWLGPSGRRVLHDSGEVRTKAAAKRAAERKLAALRR